jgi:AcrR family transcriptional regulator
MLELCLHRWYDEITLRELATQSGVALQTVINHFGTKEGVFAAMLEDPRTRAAFSGQRWNAVPGDIPGAVALLLQDYEHAGDAIIRFLALESRIPSLADLLTFGRTGQRAWLECTFPAALVGRTSAEREHRLQLLLCATDVYTWKLLRRDQGLSQDETTARVTDLVDMVHRRLE